MQVKTESWLDLDWNKFQTIVYRLQMRIYKASRVNDTAKALQLQKLLLRTRAASFIAVRQVTQLNNGKKTAGVDGKKMLVPEERMVLVEKLVKEHGNWRHQALREIDIPKKDGTKRTLKVPTINDRAWQCLMKLAMEPAHEAHFHARSYGFRTGRCAQDAQKILFLNLSSRTKGYEKRVIELDIKKCFDRIDHNTLMKGLIAPQCIKKGIYKCLKAGINPEFPERGTPQGGVVSPLLANIALNGIEGIHNSVRYADDMVIILKPEDDANAIMEKIVQFLAVRGLELNYEKTAITAVTDGFDFLGWNFKVDPKTRKFRSTPSEDNFKKFKGKVKEVVNSSAYGAKVKAKKLAPIVRGWRQYHKHCDMNQQRWSLWNLNHKAWKVFNKEKKMNRHLGNGLIGQAFPTVSFAVNKFVNVAGDKSPYDGDLVYWSKRNSKLYDGHTAKTLRKQDHKCVKCNKYFIGDERVHLHHVDGNHYNWKPSNLMAVHESCHEKIHHDMRKREPTPNQVGSRVR